MEDFKDSGNETTERCFSRTTVNTSVKDLSKSGTAASNKTNTRTCTGIDYKVID